MTILFALYMSATSARAMVGAIDITTEARDCVEVQLRARTVRLRADRGACSGTIIDDHEIRTAGHCFGQSKKLSWVRDVEGRVIATGGAVKRVGGENWSATFTEPDHAAVHFDAAVASVGPVARASSITENAEVVVAGYGLTELKQPIFRTLFSGPTRLKYYRGHLRVVRPEHARGGDAYEITPVDPKSSLGLGDSGGPAFLVRGCQLTYLGAIVGRRPGLFAPTRVFVRPHVDVTQ